MSTQPTMIAEYIRPLELARRLGVSRNTLVRWEQQGRLPRRVRIGPRAVAYDLDEVEKYFARRLRG